MGNVTIKISFQDVLLSDIDRVVRSEARSRPEFLHEAARTYIQRRERWAGIFAMGRAIAKRKGLRPGDEAKEIKSYRKSRKERPGD